MLCTSGFVDDVMFTLGKGDGSGMQTQSDSPVGSTGLAGGV